MSDKQENSNHSKKRNGYHNLRKENDWERIAQMLKESTCESVEEFYLNMDIPRSTFYDQINKNPTLKAAVEYKKEKIGIENEKYCKQHKLTGSTIVAETLIQYLPRYKDHYEWKTKIKAIAESENSNVPKAVIDYILADANRNTDTSK